MQSASSPLKNNEEEHNSLSPSPPLVRTQRGRTLRGAARKAAISSDDEKNSNDDSNSKSKITNLKNTNKPNSTRTSNANVIGLGGSGGGIYSSRLNQTKQLRKDIITQVTTQESNLI